MPIRILHVVDNWGMGGLQNGIANLIARLDPAEFEHIICGIRPVAPQDVQPFAGNGARVIGTGKPGARIQVAALAQVIRHEQPTIVHSRNWAGTEAVVAARWAGCRRIIHSEHGVDGPDEASARKKVLRRVAFELAHRVCTVSYQLRDLHARQTGFSPSKIDVIHNGVDHTRFAPTGAARERMRRELGISEDTFCIGCVGNLTTVKDHRTVLRALAETGRALGDWRLLLIGDGPERVPLEQAAAADPGLAHRVVLLGRSRRVPELLNALDLYVLSSLNEGICNSLLEAMCTGLPVVATQTGGNPEVVEDGRSGVLFPVGDSGRLSEYLLSLRTNSHRREELGRQALQRIRERFSMEAMTQKYEQLYFDVASARKAESRAMAEV